MTEFSTNNDNNKSHLSQPLQNSPRHFLNHTHQQQSPQHFANINKHLTQTFNNNKIHNQPKLPNINSSANIGIYLNNTTTTASSATASAATTATSSNTSSATHSPLHYRNPLNSPNNSPFAYAYTAYGGGVGNNSEQQQNKRAATTAQQPQQQQHYHQLQQHLRSGLSKFPLPLLTQTQYQQHLNDLLLQQQHLQQHQQQLLNVNNKDADAAEAELSEESLKQNVAIVLNNLDRYNNALRSIILNEQVSSNSSIFFDESLLDDDGSNSNNNFLLNSNFNYNNINNIAAAATSAAMAAPATPESDYNSNATTPGSRCSSNMMPLDSNMLTQQQQHLVGLANAAAACVGGVGVGNNGVLGGGNQNIGSMGGGVGGFCNNIAAASNNLNCSLASSHDFTHDNSDYQWFLDYGYRDGCSGMQRSVLSSLSASYNGIGDLIYYEDMAKNMDANLAEADMESFRTEDIHSLLSQLPSYCKSLGGNHQRLQQHLSMLPTLTAKQQQQLQQLQQAQNMSQISNSMSSMNNELIDNSICKSELLFSPVKESNISVDSLDMDAYPDDGDIILTCKANKDNYTIAFEGSVLYSDESFYAEPNEIAMKNKQNFINLHSNLEDIVKRKSLDLSMSRSEQAFTTPSKLQKSNTTQLQSRSFLFSPMPTTRRYPSGNNNTTDAITLHMQQHSNAYSTVRKSSSLPNLQENSDLQMMQACNRQQQQQYDQQQQQLNVSQALSTSIMDCCNPKSRNLLPMCQMPISCNSTSASISERIACPQLQQPSQHHHHRTQQQRHKHRCCCTAFSSSNAVAAVAVATVCNNSHNSCACATQQQQQQLQKHSHISGSGSSGSSNPPAFNLVKLFIKQKSNNYSTEDQVSSHTCMDVSSGCWPSSDAAGSSSSSSLEQRLRKKSMNDSGKGSALSRHDEEDMLLRTREDAEADGGRATTPKKHLRVRSDAVFYDEDHSSSSTGSLTVTNSPAHRRRSMPMRNPQLCQLATQHTTTATGTSAGSLQSSDGSRSNSEQLTQVYVSSNGTTNSGATLERKKSRCADAASRPASTASSSEMITRSMQTSCSSLSTRSSFSDRLRCVPPSFLSKLNKLGEEKQAPIYVIYPNYALPDLGFVKTNSSADVIFSPFNYKMAVGSAGIANSGSAWSKKRHSITESDDELLKTMDFKHVVDWKSLATLLPPEYRRRLKHIPEVNKVIKEMEGQSQLPLFCQTPPNQRNVSNICDCAQYYTSTQTQAHPQGPATGQEGSSSSGSSQQPSSGYRGSSTLLTDSELDTTGADPLKQMYVYQYEQQRMDSGVEMSPASAAGKTPPQPMPRGILRKSSGTRNKRNSMIEEQETKLSKLEKRRSLQEPPYHGPLGSAEELCEVFEEETDIYAVPQPRKERLSRKDLDARARAESFLSSLPRSELKYYAEIASILELSSEYQAVEYDAAALKQQVSRVLSQQKRVSFNDIEEEQQQQHNAQQQQRQQQFLNAESRQRFSTPPNSPNISMASGGAGASTVRMQQQLHANTVPRRCTQMDLHTASERKKLASLDEKEQRKIESNRFKRLQIQWELMSKDSSMLKDLANAQHTQSGGSTPTSAQAHKSRIPRPVSYPAGKKTTNVSPKPSTSSSKTSTCISPQIARITTQEALNGKTTRSPSRIVPPKRYSMISVGSPGSNLTTATTIPPSIAPAGAAATTTSTTPTSTTSHTIRARTPNSRGSAGVAVTAPNTPRRRVQSPRTIPRVR